MEDLISTEAVTELTNRILDLERRKKNWEDLANQRSRTLEKIAEIYNDNDDDDVARPAYFLKVKEILIKAGYLETK